MRIRIVDEAVSPTSDIRSPDHIGDRHFKAFVSTIATGIGKRLSEAGFCGTSGSEFLFMRMPLVTSGDAPFGAVPSLEARSTDECRIESPWLDIRVARAPNPEVRAIFLWSERQFLQDQAVLAGAEAPAALRAPLSRSHFERMAQEYADKAILGKPSAQTQPLEEHIPPDVLWLFRKATQSTLAPFSDLASGAMRNVLDLVGATYTRLVLALAERCLSPDGSSRRYGSILEAAGAVPLEAYRIDQLD